MKTDSVFRFTAAAVIVTAAVVAACSKGAAPSSPSAVTSASTSADSGRVSGSAVGDTKVGSGGLDLIRLRMDRQTTPGVQGFRQYVDPNRSYKYEPGEYIELWAEWDANNGFLGSTIPTNPRLIIDWGLPGVERDFTPCGGCLLRRQYVPRGVWTVRVILDDRNGTTVTRTFVLDASLPDPTPTPTPSATPSPEFSPTPSPSPTPTPSSPASLTVNAQAGSGSGTVTSITGSDFTVNCSTNCTQTASGAAPLFNLVATASPGSFFDHWSGACSGNGGCSGSVTIGSSTTVTAHFTTSSSPTPTPSISPTPTPSPTPTLYTITITPSSSTGGKGQVNDSFGTYTYQTLTNQGCGPAPRSTSCQIVVPAGTVVDLYAIPDGQEGPVSTIVTFVRSLVSSSDYVESWGGACAAAPVGSSVDPNYKTCSLGAVNSNKTVSVSFKK